MTASSKGTDRSLLRNEQDICGRLLVYNDRYKEDAESARRNVGIPEGGFSSILEAVRWRVRHCADHGYPDHNPYLGDLDTPRATESLDRLQIQEFWTYDPEASAVPLYHAASALVERYRAAPWAFCVIVWHLLTGEFAYLDPKNLVVSYPPAYLGPAQRPVRVEYPSEHEVQLTFWIDELTTKKDVVDLWPTVRMLRDELSERTGITPPHRRRGASTEKSERQWASWLEIYRVYQELRSFSKTALWLTERGQEVSEETVRSTVQRLRAWMMPTEKLASP